MDNQRSRIQLLIASALATSLFGISTPGLASGDSLSRSSDMLGVGERRLSPAVAPPEPEGTVVSQQLGGANNTRFLPRVMSGMIPVGTPVMLTWSYAADVAPSDHLSPLPGILAPADPNAPTFYQAMEPEPSRLVQTLDDAFPRGQWLEIVARCFDRWSAVCGITFQFVDSSGPASPTAPPDSDPNDYDPWDSGDRWESIVDDDAAGFYAPPGANYNWTGDPGVTVAANEGVGDIRIAARTIDGRSSPDGVAGSAFYYVYPYDPAGGSGAGEGTAEMGNIILDSEEIWNDPFAPNIFEVVMMRAIGEAVGVSYKCPRWVPNSGDPLLKGQLMELQEGDFINDNAGLTRPFPPLRILEPQEDDIRTVQQLYGDPTDGNDGFTAATTIRFVPNFNSPEVRYEFIHPDTNQPTTTLLNRAITTFDFGAGDPDLDFYEIIVPPLFKKGTLTITVTPLGTEYYSVGYTIDGNGARICDADASTVGPGDVINALELDDLRFTLATLDELDSFLYDVIDPDNPDSPWHLPFEGAPGPADQLTYVDAGTFGEPEAHTMAEVEPGRYFLIVRGRDDFQGDQAVQRYNLTISLVEQTPPSSASFAGVLNGNEEVPFPGTGRLALTERFDNGGPFTGETARLAVIAGGLAYSGHTVFDDTTVVETAWDGPNPSTSVRTNEATRIAAAAGGREIVAQEFVGMAQVSEIVSTSVALQGQSPLQPNFPVSLQAIYYSLFGIARPEVYESLGLTGAPTVYLNLYNTPYIDRSGESLISLAYDAASTMLNVPIVHAAGEFGTIDNDEDCNGTGPENGPGSDRIGSRSLSSPATTFNGITVTAVGARTHNATPQYQFPYYALPANSSSQGPIDTQGTLNARAGIDIAAPGWAAVVDTPVPPGPDGNPDPCLWFGHPPIDLLSMPALAMDNGNPDPNAFSLAGGTNIAAAVTAGAIALLQDAGNKFVDEQFPEGGVSTAPLVLKSILLNSAVKLPGWSNSGTSGAGIPAAPINRRDGRPWEAPGVVVSGVSTGGLDAAVGAGLLNVEQAFLNYLGPGVTKDPTETDPRIPTVTAAGPYIGPVVPGPDGEAGVDAGGGDLPIGLPGSRPSNGGIGNPGSFLPGVTGPAGGATGPIPGPGGGNLPPVALRLFLADVGLGLNADGQAYDPSDPELSDPSDFPAVQLADIPLNPRYFTLAEYNPNTPNDVQRLYIWAAYEGQRDSQRWDNVSLNISVTGDAVIADYRIFNISAELVPGTTITRWSTLLPGTPTPALPATKRIANISMSAAANSPAVGLFRDTNSPLDPHYSTGVEATLVGYIDVVGQGEVFLEVGNNGINHRDVTPAQSRIYFGPGGNGAFADDNNPIIWGNQIGRASAFPEALLDTIGLVETPIPVRRVGWDHGNLGVIGELGHIDYFIEEPLELNTLFTATLVWNRTVVIAADDFLDSTNPGAQPTVLQVELENLDLELWTADPFGNVQDLIASTTAPLTNVEQLRFLSNDPGYIGAHLVLRVIYRNTPIAFENANFADLTELNLGDYELRFLRPGDVEFALAWATWTTDLPGLPANVQGSLESAYNLPEGLLLPGSITMNASVESLMESLSQMLMTFGTSRGERGFRSSFDLNNNGVIDSDDIAMLLNAF